MKKSLVVACLSAMMIGTGVSTINANASGLSGYNYARLATKNVKVKKTVMVYVIELGSSEASSHAVKYMKITPGFKLKVSKELMSMGVYVIKSKFFHPTKHAYYMVSSKNHNWYK